MEYKVFLSRLKAIMQSLVKKSRIAVLVLKRPVRCNYHCESTLRKSPSKPAKTAGILGWIDKRSKTDTLILGAVKDGMERIIIYGCMVDAKWYYTKIEPMIKQFPNKIQYAGCVKNKQKIYDSISDAYNVSGSRLAICLKKECQLTGTKYHD